MTPRSTPWGAYGGIAAELRRRVAELPAGSAVPSEAALAAEFRVVRNTVRRALSELESEGLIRTLPGRGRVVQPPQGEEIGGDDRPVYQRVASEIRASIESGELRPGARLPSEAELMREHRISRGTARQALSLLETAGLVDVRHGKGRYVRA